MPVVVADCVRRSDWLEYPSKHVAEFLKSRGIDYRENLQNIQVREGVLEAGERVAVLGVCHREADRSAYMGYRTQAGLVVLSAGDGASLVISDDPRSF